jgi:bifunctional non-homologous end joining protein LigD
MTVELTSLDKVLWPASGFTKRQLIDYYVEVADVLIPHVAGRPMTLGRWPSGIDGPGFAQTECRGAPEWVATRALRLRGGGVRNFCLLNDRRSLIWAANLGTIELHPYLGGGRDGEDAVVAIFDLDPRPGASLVQAAEAAVVLRELLAARRLDAFAKTSGGHGIHVFVPLNIPHSFEQTRAFCKEVAAELDTSAVKVDCAQNHARRSLAAPYSLRATTVLPAVSTPVTWAELERAVAAGQPDLITFTALDLPARLERVGDLFRPVLDCRQRLPPSG